MLNFLIALGEGLKDRSAPPLPDFATLAGTIPDHNLANEYRYHQSFHCMSYWNIIYIYYTVTSPKCRKKQVKIAVVLTVPKNLSFLFIIVIMKSVVSVSYTHLDVYKRQVLGVSRRERLRNNYIRNILGIYNLNNKIK